MKMYGLQFEIVSEPIVMGDDLVFVDATETRSGRPRRMHSTTDHEYGETNRSVIGIVVEKLPLYQQPVR